MKKTLYFLIAVMFIISGCNAAKDYMKVGNFDMASKVAAQKLLKNKNKKKMIEILQESYPKAVQNDFEAIKYLHQEGKPDRWENVFLTYDNMKSRQQLVENTYPLFLDGKQVKFDHYDFDQQMLEAKAKAADYFYTHAKLLKSQHTKQGYRDAFYEFLKVQTYSASYLDADQLMNQCYDSGQTYLLLIAVNNTPFKLNNDFFINLINFNTNDLNTFWSKYYTTDVRKGKYDGYIYVNLNRIDVSPNNSSVREYTESTEVTDGWEYKVDDKGNVMKDTSGNPIKIPKKKVVTCKITETRQFKKAHIEGTLTYVLASNKQVIQTIPIAADNLFENFFSKADGDTRALTNETKAKLQNKPVSYPYDLDMIYGANQTLKGVIMSALQNNKQFVDVNFM